MPARRAPCSATITSDSSGTTRRRCSSSRRGRNARDGTSPAASIRMRAGTRSWRRPSSMGCASALWSGRPGGTGGRRVLYPPRVRRCGRRPSCLPFACPGSDGPRRGGGGGGRAAAPRSRANGRPAAGCTRTGRTSPGGSWRRRSLRQRPTVTFPVRFGAQPRLLISYLRSYEGFGDAAHGIEAVRRVPMGAIPDRPPVHAGRAPRAAHSQATSEFFEASSTFAQDVAPTAESALEGRAHLGNAGGAGFAVPPNTSGFATVRLRRPSSSAASRFKVLAVVSC